MDKEDTNLLEFTKKLRKEVKKMSEPKIRGRDVLERIGGQIVTRELKKQIAELLHVKLRTINYHIWTLRDKIRLSPELQKIRNNQVGKPHHWRGDNKQAAILRPPSSNSTMTLAQLVDIYAYLIERDRRCTTLEKENIQLKNENAQFSKNVALLKIKAEELDQLNKKLRLVQGGSVVLHSD